MNAVAQEIARTPLKLDLGCGKKPRDGFEGVDERDFGQAHKLDLREPWPWPDGSVDEVFSSHFVEHLKPMERVHFVNELHRVLVKPEYGPDGKPTKGFATIIVPHWAGNRAYGDMTHQWPPVAEFWFYYLSKPWREEWAPHNDFYSCDFNVTWGYSQNPAIANRHEDFQRYAIEHYRDAIYDIVATMTKL